MAWTSLTFAYGSVLTSTKMTQLQDNFGYGTGSPAPNFTAGITGTTAAFTGAISGTTGTFSGAVSGTTITASAGFLGGTNGVINLYDTNWGVYLRPQVTGSQLGGKSSIAFVNASSSLIGSIDSDGNFVAVGAISGTTITGSGAITSSSPTAGIGYAAGAGGTVTQVTSITTSVTLDKVCGKITCVSNAFVIGTDVEFQFNNSTIGTNDCLIFSVSDASSNAGVIVTTVRQGSGAILLRLTPRVSATLVLVINFAVIKVVV